MAAPDRAIAVLSLSFVCVQYLQYVHKYHIECPVHITSSIAQ